MVYIEAINHSVIDGYEPYKACHTVEDTSYAALLSRHTCQLAVRTVKDVGHHQQEDGNQVHAQPPPAGIIEAPRSKEYGGTSPDNHRPDGDGVRMYVKFGKSQSTIVAEGAYDM